MSALTITDEPGKIELTVQVAQHLGQGKVRCVAISPEAGLAPGMRVVDTGAPVAQALAPHSLVQAFNLLGDTGRSRSPVSGRHTGDTALPTPPRDHEILETGIKVIDLLCPYRRGGKVAILGGMGVGKLVLIEEVVHNVAAREGEFAIFTFVHPGTEIAWERDTMRNRSGIGAVQTVVLSSDDVFEPLGSDNLFDATTYLSRDMAVEMHYPAVDPLRSSSRALDPAIVGQAHFTVATEVRALLERYTKLRAQTDPSGSRLSESDGVTISRARRIQRFLTQPFFIAEPYTKRPGAFVSCQATIEGCAALLSGTYDDVPEEVFLFASTLEEVIDRARTLSQKA